jgi:hypothetical protein
VDSIIWPKAEKLNIKPRKSHLYNIKIYCTKIKETQFVHSAAEVNKRRGQWSHWFRYSGDKFMNSQN